MIETSDATLRDTRERVHDVLMDILPALGRQGIDEGRHLRDMGADSVDRVEIIMTLMERFDLRVPMSRFSDVPDLGALVRLLALLRGEAT